MKICFKVLKVGKVKGRLYIRYESSTPSHQNFASPQAKNKINAYTH